MSFIDFLIEGSSYHRSPKSKQEKSKAAGSEVDEMEPKARAKRNANNLPDSWDDKNPGRQRSWKKHRKTQYKLKEGYELYHDSYTSAVQAAKDIATSRGYTIDDDEAMRVVGMGPKKPSPGETNDLHLNLYGPDGKQRRERLHFQVYNRGTDQHPYELNVYIS